MDRKRLVIHIHGTVQGVGFRPFIYRLAVEYGLGGFVRNDTEGVEIQVEGSAGKLEQFLSDIPEKKPALARIYHMEYKFLETAGFSEFRILESQSQQTVTALVLPDLATCDECLDELFDPADRRYFYPFTNCTNCGPRYTIIAALPYDRPNTTMKNFTMCPECKKEYHNPLDRRYHAQPNACPVCGPKVWLTDSKGYTIGKPEEALHLAAELLLQGKILAVKGIGGFHLMVDATDPEAVRRLRERKKRYAKPLALMVQNLEMAEAICEISPQERLWLTGPEAPILLLKREKIPSIFIADDVAPANPFLGIMLPYSPLHHLLLNLVRRPVVATSGNISEEPLCYENEEALLRLGAIAEFFLLHNRPILHPVDDSVMRIVNDQPLMIRRARGFTPLPVILPSSVGEAVAAGAQLKNTIAFSREKRVFISQHIGDLENLETEEHYRSILSHLQQLYSFQPEIVLVDKHPDYRSTTLAGMHFSASSHHAVQHHRAHLYATILENEVPLPALGVSWDGTGYGDDGTIWGGEFFLVEPHSCRRIATLLPFRLAGGEQAVRQPWRVAVALLLESLFPSELQAIRQGKSARDVLRSGILDDMVSFPVKDESSILTVTELIARGIQSPSTTSMGRLFDGMASILGICHMNRFEGEAAMQLEWVAMGHSGKEPNRREPVLSFHYNQTDGMVILDWRPLVRAAVKQFQPGKNKTLLAYHFHYAMVEAISHIASLYRMERIVLGGGCFQNALLIRMAEEMLTRRGMRVYRPQMIPPNDGGISVGQIGALIFEPETIRRRIHVSGSPR